jgi:hypothetical protein
MGIFLDGNEVDNHLTKSEKTVDSHAKNYADLFGYKCEGKMNNLEHAAATFNAVMDKISEQYQDLSREELFDTVDGETDFSKIMDRALWRVTKDELDQVSIQDVIAKLHARKKRLGERADTVKSAMMEAMTSIDKKKYELPSATISIRSTPPKVVIIDEKLIPDQFVTLEPKINKSAIKDALKSGDVEGATLSNGGATLSIRRD